MRSTELRKHNDPLPLNCHDRRCLKDAFPNKLGACDTVNWCESIGRPELDDENVDNCRDDDDAQASPLSSQIGIIIQIFKR